MSAVTACRDVRDLLEMRAYGLLDDPSLLADRARLDAHLAGCEACALELDAERAITASLTALARVQVSVSAEARVMEGVRAEAARQAAAFRLSRRQKTVLGGAALFGMAAEMAVWALVALTVVQFPAVRALTPTLSAAEDFGRPVLLALSSGVEVAAVLLRAALTVLRVFTELLPPPAVSAGLFLALVSLLTFVAVRRDLRRSPAPARGLR